MKIGLIGIGNAGSHIAKVLHRHHLGLQAVYSRNREKVERIGKKLSVIYVHELDRFPKDLDLYILAVPDSAISAVAEQLAKDFRGGAVVHVSGSSPMNLLKPYFDRYGVFYPLQTLTSDRKVKFKEVPFCIEANTEALETTLIDLARKISDSVHLISSADREWLHVAAVMVNNFVNHLYVLSEKIMIDKQLDFNLLRPLIIETAKKVQKSKPIGLQTGPAIRGDVETIQKHIQKLQEYPDLQKVYKQLTESLLKEAAKQRKDIPF